MLRLEVITSISGSYGFSIEENGRMVQNGIFGNWQLAAQSKEIIPGEPEIDVQFYDPNTQPDAKGRIWPKAQFTLDQQHLTHTVRRGFLGLGAKAVVTLGR